MVQLHEFHSIDSRSYMIVNLTKFARQSPQVCSSWLSARSTRIIKASQDYGAWNWAPSSRRAVGIVRKMWIGIRESGKRRNINVNATGLEKARMRIAGREGSFKKARRKETKTLRLALGCWHAGIRPSEKSRGKYMEMSVIAAFYFSPRFRRPPSPYIQRRVLRPNEEWAKPYLKYTVTRSGMRAQKAIQEYLRVSYALFLSVPLPWVGL